MPQTIDVMDLVEQLELARVAGAATDEQIQDIIDRIRARGLGVCRVCYCTDVSACDDGCWWVEDDLCSSCEDRA